MKVTIDFKQASTWRGAVWAFFGVLALGTLYFGSAEKATTVMAIASTIAGGLGLGVSDNGK